MIAWRTYEGNKANTASLNLAKSEEIQQRAVRYCVKITTKMATNFRISPRRSTPDLPLAAALYILTLINICSHFTQQPAAVLGKRAKKSLSRTQLATSC